MYKSIEQIRKLRKNKREVLERVYQSSDLDCVYENQRELGSMSINIFTDVADVILPVLRDDEVGNIVWSNISLRLNKLSFVSVPTAARVREKYQKDVDNPTAKKRDDTTSKPKTRTKEKRSLRSKEISDGIKKAGKSIISSISHKAERENTVNYEEMYKQAIQETYRNNCKILDAWFDRLEKITTEEIYKALKEVEG